MERTPRLLFYFTFPCESRIYPEGIGLGSKTSLSFTPSFCAAIQVALCTRLLTGRPLESGRLYMADLLDMELQSLF